MIPFDGKQKPIRLLLFTWNVGHKSPDPADLQHWLPGGGGQHDMIVIGTQENGQAGASAKETDEDGNIEDTTRDTDLTSARSPGGVGEEGSNTVVALTSSNAEPRQAERRKSLVANKAEIQWEQIVAARLAQGGGSWRRIARVFQWEMALAVFARREHAAQIRNVQVTRVATGVGAVLGNKGGLIIKLECFNTSLCFVSCHLAAHAWKLRGRNRDCQAILKGALGSVGVPQLEAVSQFDHVFWMGDLNYRVDMQLGGPASDPYNYSKANEKSMLPPVELAIKNGDYASLLAHDQLRYCQQTGDAFVGFTEGEPKFPPTFKMERAAGCAYNTKRIPSYTDRILWKSMPPLSGHVTQTAYHAAIDVATSDHKPVFATFEVKPTLAIARLRAPKNSQFTLLTNILGGVSRRAQVMPGAFSSGLSRLGRASSRMHERVNRTPGRSSDRAAGLPSTSTDGAVSLAVVGSDGASTGRPTPMTGRGFDPIASVSTDRYGSVATDRVASIATDRYASLRIENRASTRRVTMMSASAAHDGHGGVLSPLKSPTSFAAPLVRLSSCLLDGILAADYDGTSDPYLAFFTNPPGLIVGGTPISAIKKALAKKPSDEGEGRAPKRRGSITRYSAAVGAAVRHSVVGSDSATAQTQTVRLNAAELPLLRLLVRTLAELEKVTLIVAVYDHDHISSDDYLGACAIPLGRALHDEVAESEWPESPDAHSERTFSLRPAAAPAVAPAVALAAAPVAVPVVELCNEYCFDVNEPIVLGNLSKDTGAVRMRVTVTGGSKLQDALQAARAEDAGAQSSTLASKRARRFKRALLSCVTCGSALACMDCNSSESRLNTTTGHQR